MIKIACRRRDAATELLRRVLLGYDLLYLLRGAPVVYYGDEVGIDRRAAATRRRARTCSRRRSSSGRREQRVGSPPIGTGSSFDVVAQPDRATS